MSDSINERGKSLEDSFFHQRDRELLAKLKQSAGAGDVRKELAAAIGVDDGAVIDKLIAMAIKPEMALAVSMVPLVQVAWADGVVQDAERDAIKSAAKEAGIESGTPADGMLESWLSNQPSGELTEAWQGYIKAIVEKLTDKECAELKEATLHRARIVAGAAGGILGLGSKFSKSEKAVLEDLATAFG